VPFSDCEYEEARVFKRSNLKISPSYPRMLYALKPLFCKLIFDSDL
jgi:hypothetical protein